MPKQYDNKQISIVGEFNGSFIFFTDKVTGFTLPAGVTSIKSGAFGYRENVTYINLPDTITSLNMGSFESCSGLSKLIISKNITSLNLSAWYMFSKPANNIQQIIVDERNSVFDSRNNCNAIINTKTNELVYGCKTTTIVEGIKSIGNRAFYMCTSLNSITIPSSVESINQTAFSGCSGVTSIVVNSENQYFDSRNNCNAIIRKNDNLIVRGCNNTDLSVLSRVTVIGQNAFDDCSGLSGNLTIPNNITSIEGSAFENCSGLTGISIGNGLTSISNYAFSGCSGLTGRLIIPDSVTSIGWNAFQNCSGLTGLSIGNGITSIDSSTFESCRGLTGGLIIPSGVTSIGSSAFEYCSKLTSVYIPSSVTTITASSYAYAPFYTCSSSLVIYTDVANASSVPSGWSTYWNYYDSSTQLTVNYGVSLETYKTTVGLAFAPKTASDEPLEKDGDIKIDNNYLSFAPDYNPEAILNEEKEYVIIPKKTGE